MPELPDITVYVEALRERIGGARLERYRLLSPFLLRSVEPPLDALVGLRVATLERLGKRIVIGFEGGLFLVIHLMIAGRLQWRTDRPKKPIPNTQLVLELETGTLFMTEAGTKRRASLYVVRGRDALAEHDRRGLEVAGATAEQFRAVLTRGNHTLKRAMTDPTMLSGIGNA